jgi:MFS family permease
MIAQPLPAETDLRRPWTLVWVLAAAQVVSWGAIYYGFSLFVVPMESELGWSRTTLNGALSLGLLTTALCAWPVGAWIDRHGGRLVMTAGSALGVVLLAAWSQVESVPAFYLIWIGLGAAMSATLYEPAFAVVTRLFPRTYRTRITAMTLVGGFASTVFIPLTQLLIATFGWRHALLTLALIVAAICLPIHGLVLQDGRGASGGGPSSASAAPPLPGNGALHRALRTWTFWGLALCFTAYYATFSALTFHLVPLLTERGLAMTVIVGAMAVIGPAQVAGRVALLALGRRAHAGLVGRVVVLVFPASVLLLLLFPTSLAALFAFAALYGAANGIMTIVRGTSVPDLLWVEGYGAINGALALPATAAKAAAPFAAALIWAAAGGYDAVLWAIFTGSLLAVLGFWLAAATGRSA